MVTSSLRFHRLAFLLALLPAACSRSSAPPPAPAAAAAPAPSGPIAIDIAKVTEQPLALTLSLPGELAPFQSVAIYSRVSGFVKAVAVDRGSSVGQGVVLVTLEAPELVAQFAEAQSKLQAAEAQLSAVQAKAESDRGTFDRLKAASATPGVVAGNDLAVSEKVADASQKQVESVRQQVEAARQAARAVREMEGYLRITAPFAGTVTERNIHPGALVSTSAAGTPLLRIVDARRLRLVVAVPESYTAGIARGTSVAFSVAAFPGEAWKGTVARVAQSVDTGTRTMAVELDVDNGDGRLSPGAYCQVRWPVTRKGASLFVPSGSVTSTTDRTFVVRIRSGKTEWVDVRTGLTSGPLIEVFGDLHAGDEIAARGSDELRPGTQVRQRETKPAA